MNAEALAKTGFLTSIISYVIFWLADLARPGFVARYLSVHVFLLAAVVFGAWWMSFAPRGKGRAWVQYPIALCVSVLLGVLVWNAGEGLAEYRILITGFAALAPVIVVSLIRST